jgi:hypothetical protein
MVTLCTEILLVSETDVYATRPSSVPARDQSSGTRQC